MRHFAHNIGDYAAATRHLSFVEDAAYRRLLDRYYQDEKPLPADLAAVSRLAGARTKEERQAVANVLAEFFTLEDDGYHQSRADREIETYRSKAQLARDNGTKGGRPANRGRTKTVTPQVRSEKLTTPHSPLPNSLTTTLTVANSAQGASQSRSVLISDDWEPSEIEVAALKAERPDIAGELYDQRMRDFRDWCSANATRTFNPAATWRGFMRKTKRAEVGETFDQKRIRRAMEAIR